MCLIVLFFKKGLSILYIYSYFPQTGVEFRFVYFSNKKKLKKGMCNVTIITFTIHCYSICSSLYFPCMFAPRSRYTFVHRNRGGVPGN